MASRTRSTTRSSTTCIRTPGKKPTTCRSHDDVIGRLVVVAPRQRNDYICRRGAARCDASHIPGALSILKGAVPGRARGLGHMAPTYFRREPGIDAPTAVAAPHFPFVLTDALARVARSAGPDARRRCCCRHFFES